MYSPYMEAPHAAYPPVYDEPEATKQEVLDVVFGLRDQDSKRRGYDELMGDTDVGLFFERIDDDYAAKREFLFFIGHRLGELPPSVRAILEDLAEAAAQQKPEWEDFK